MYDLAVEIRRLPYGYFILMAAIGKYFDPHSSSLPEFVQF